MLILVQITSNHMLMQLINTLHVATNKYIALINTRCTLRNTKFVALLRFPSEIHGLSTDTLRTEWLSLIQDISDTRRHFRDPLDNKSIRAHRHPSQRAPSQSPSEENGHRWLSHLMPVRIRHCPRCWLRSPALCMCSWSRTWQCCRRVHQGSNHSLCRQMHHSYMGQCSTMAHCTMRPAGTGAFAQEVRV